MITVVNTNSTDPAFNLAVEQYLMLNKFGDFFYFWRNDRSVIVGRNQNTASEINYEFVEKSHIGVFRRLSGGGAVFHDLGNINYSLITDFEQGRKIDFENYSRPIIKILKSFGIAVELNGRNDLIVDNAKISGTAQFVKNGRLLHHGTLLFSADLSEMEGALISKPEKFIGKSSKSVRSRVSNLQDIMTQKISVDEFEYALTHILIKDNPGVISRGLYTSEKNEIEQLAENVYRNWEWNYGRSPNFSCNKTMKFSCGIVECYFEVVKGQISKVKLFGDFFGLKDIKKLENLLTGVLHNRKAINTLLIHAGLDNYVAGAQAAEFVELFF